MFGLRLFVLYLLFAGVRWFVCGSWFWPVVSVVLCGGCFASLVLVGCCGFGDWYLVLDCVLILVCLRDEFRLWLI